MINLFPDISYRKGRGKSKTFFEFFRERIRTESKKGERLRLSDLIGSAVRRATF
jgi:hypothetical protein